MIKYIVSWGATFFIAMIGFEIQGYSDEGWNWLWGFGGTLIGLGVGLFIFSMLDD